MGGHDYKYMQSPPSQRYRDGWDRIFGKSETDSGQKETKDAIREQSKELLEQADEKK